jgi:hypothetical protein
MGRKERVMKTLDHEQPDRLPVDLGNSVWAGIRARANVPAENVAAMIEAVKEFNG